MTRLVVLLLGIVAALPAAADEMKPDEARRFISGKLFAYNCFDGTRGAGRIFVDGSVVGTIQIRGDGPVRMASLPTGTLQIKGEAVCASMRGLPFEPCFNLERTDQNSFRGSVSGLGFAYCDFTRRNGRTHIVRVLQPSSRPLGLRPSIAAADSR